MTRWQTGLVYVDDERIGRRRLLVIDNLLQDGMRPTLSWTRVSFMTKPTVIIGP